MKPVTLKISKRCFQQKRGAFRYMFFNCLKARTSSFQRFTFSMSRYPKNNSVLEIQEDRKVMRPAKGNFWKAGEPQFPCFQRFPLSTHETDRSVLARLHQCCHLHVICPASALPMPVMFSHLTRPSLLGKECMSQDTHSDHPRAPSFFLTWSPSPPISSGD